MGFWFSVGFPFANHNESYFWLALFETKSPWEVLTTRLEATATYRPLGQALAFFGYQAAGQSGALVQLFNFLAAAAAWLGLALILRETRVFALSAALIGGGFFAGYIYLFHIHGIFYSPILMLIAGLVYLYECSRLGAVQRDVSAFGAALLGWMFHPYALIVFLSFLLGRFIERRERAQWTGLWRVAGLASASMLLIWASRPVGHVALSQTNLSAWLTSYRLTEVSELLSLLSALLAFATILSFGESNPRRTFYFSIVVGALCVLFYLYGFPLLPIWIGACIAKAAHAGKWSLVGLLVGTAALPVLAPSGSPTYAVFVILSCCIVLSRDWQWAERRLKSIGHRWIFCGYLLAACLVVLLRSGVELPVVSSVARPVLVEREKTYQLEDIIQWMLESGYGSRRLLLDQNVENPVHAGVQAVMRHHRPPTYQIYLDAYLASQREQRELPSSSDGGDLVVTFGGQPKPGLEPTKSVPGRFAGSAMVFEMPVE